MSTKKITFAIPTYNSEKTIAECLHHLLLMKYPKEELEILIHDGGSNDLTKEIISEYEKENHCIRIIPGQTGNKSRSRNRMIKEAKGTIIIPFSAHVNCDPLLAKIIEEKFKEYNTAAIGFPNITPNQNIIGNAIGSAVQGFFAGGTTTTFTQNAQFAKEKFVDHMPFTAYKKEVFDKIGLYDEDIQNGEDAELNIRLKKAGMKLLYTPETFVKHHKPTTLRKLFIKMIRYGIARSKIIKKHPDTNSILYIIPQIFVITLIIFLGLLALQLFPIQLGILAGGGYALMSMISSFTKSKNPLYAVLSIIIYPTIHIGYGVGLLYENTKW